MIGGVDTGWPSGSIFSNEGQRIYDLIRKEKPNLVVEVGAFHGCSTTWIAAALRDNKKGLLISYDIQAFGTAWGMVPEWAEEFVSIKEEDALTCQVPEDIDILWEDGSHAPGFTEAIHSRFKAKIHLSHDYMHRDVGKHVKPEFDKVLGEPDEVFFEEPSDCGIAIKWVK